MHIHSDSVIYMFNTGLFAVIEKQLHSTCLYSSIKKLVQQMRNCNVKQWSPAASVLQRGFYRCRSISLVLSRSRFLSMAHGKPSARAPTQRACGHLVPPTPPPTARGPTGLSLSLSFLRVLLLLLLHHHRKTTLPHSGGRNWVASAPRNFPLGFLQRLRWTVADAEWQKEKKPPSPLSFLPLLTEPDGFVMIFRAIEARSASALAQWQAGHPLVPAAALIAVVAHFLQRLAF